MLCASVGKEGKDSCQVRGQGLSLPSVLVSQAQPHSSPARYPYLNTTPTTHHLFCGPSPSPPLLRFSLSLLPPRVTPGAPWSAMSHFKALSPGVRIRVLSPGSQASTPRCADMWTGSRQPWRTTSLVCSASNCHFLCILSRKQAQSGYPSGCPGYPSSCQCTPLAVQGTPPTAQGTPRLSSVPLGCPVYPSAVSVPSGCPG